MPAGLRDAKSWFNRVLMKGLRLAINPRRKVIVETMLALGRPRRLRFFEGLRWDDYIRLSILELCAEEIRERGVAGAMAEVGVFQGNFAARMSQLLPDRKIYLFDTFEGFDGAQLAHDQKKYHHGSAPDFAGTSPELVLAKLPDAKRGIIRRGLFPETAQGVDDSFCLVSLDADLFDPIYEGLRFFWPRLNVGGYVFVHDYNNAQFPGVMAAVKRFAGEEGVPYVPLTDLCGSAVLAR